MITLNDVVFCWSKQAKLTIQIKHLTIDKGELVFLHGPSGSGKSTLLGLLAGIQTPTRGTISILDTDFSQLSNRKRDQFRANHIGTIFQNFNLLPYLNALENVLMGCHFSKARQQRALQHASTLQLAASQLLIELGIAAPLHTQAVNELSIGQQQRIAAARALIGGPELIIADEPTSALDSNNREAFITMLFTQAKRLGSTVLFVSHDQSLAPLFDRQIRLSDINTATQGAAV
jgi:putative ABC transport system ATP-binding protein